VGQASSLSGQAVAGRPATTIVQQKKEKETGWKLSHLLRRSILIHLPHLWTGHFVWLAGFAFVDFRKKCCPGGALFATNQLTGQP